MNQLGSYYIVLGVSYNVSWYHRRVEFVSSRNLPRQSVESLDYRICLSIMRPLMYLSLARLLAMHLKIM